MAAWNLRQTILHYNNACKIGEEYAAYRENTDRVFLADPYYLTNFASYLKDDLARISATSNFSGFTSWDNMPTVIIIPLLAGSHWRVVKVDIDYALGSCSITLKDPYGQGGFSRELKATITEAVSTNIQVLLAKQAAITSNITAANLNGDILTTEEATDQQGRGSNGWDCGPITFSNIKDYLEFVISPKAHLEFTIGAANETEHASKIAAVRSTDIDIYSRVANSSVNQERVTEAKNALENQGKELLLQAKVTDAADAKLINEIAKLDAFYLGILFEALESNRLLFGLSSTKPYNLLELKNAYQVVEAEVIRASSLHLATNEQTNSNYNNNIDNYTNKNFKVNQANFNYYNKLLNNFELLAQAAAKGNLSVSKAVNLSFRLDNDLTEQAINASNDELLLAGLMSLEHV